MSEVNAGQKVNSGLLPVRPQTRHTGASSSTVGYDSAPGDANLFMFLMRTIDQMKANLEKIHKAFEKSDVEKQKELEEAKKALEKAKQKMEKLASLVRSLMSGVSPENAGQIMDSIGALVQEISQILGAIESQPEIMTAVRDLKVDLNRINEALNRRSSVV